MLTLQWKDQTLESNLTDLEAVEIVKTLSGEFPRSLVLVATGKQGMSINQRYWLHKLANDSLKAEKNKVDVSKFYKVASKMLRDAGGRLQKPKIRLLSVSGNNQEIKAFLGSLNDEFSDGTMFLYGNDKLVGMINNKGILKPKNGLEAWILPTLNDFADNPEKSSKRYGALTGRCCFCYLRLSNEISVKLGYGPVCAKHYGLPH